MTHSQPLCLLRSIQLSVLETEFSMKSMLFQTNKTSHISVCGCQIFRLHCRAHPMQFSSPIEMKKHQIDNSNLPKFYFAGNKRLGESFGRRRGWQDSFSRILQRSTASPCNKHPERFVLAFTCSLQLFE